MTTGIGASRATHLALAVLVCSALLSGCTPRKTPTITRADVEKAIASGALPQNAKITELLPTTQLSEQQARRAVSDMRTAVVDGHAESPTWLAVQTDGSFVATGYFSGDSGTSSSWDGKTRSFATLQVPENVGGLDIIHAVPLIILDDAPVMLNGKRYKFSTLSASEGNAPISIGDFWVEVRFTVQAGWIRADSISYTSREYTWGAWPDDYPAMAGNDESTLSQDASRAAGPGASWLAIRSGCSPIQLQGYSAGSMTSDPPSKGGVVASVDLTIPDRLGPAAVYHVVQVFYTDAGLLPSEAGVSGPIRTLTAVRVRLTRGRLMAIK